MNLKEFGAFVEFPVDDSTTETGLVHVSEVSGAFVDNIYAHIAEGDEVEVKIVEVKPDGKISLSMRQADPEVEEEGMPNLKPRDDKKFRKRLRRFMHKSQMIQGHARRQRKSRLGMD